MHITQMNLAWIMVSDLEKSKDFFTTIGFRLNTHYGNSADSASLIIGERDFVLMLFSEPVFKGFTHHELTDAYKGSEMLMSFDAESRAEVDEIAAKAVEAGGTLFGKPAEIQGWMYGCGFSDLDGHRWNVLYMDMSKLPKQ